MKVACFFEFCSELIIVMAGLSDINLLINKSGGKVFVGTLYTDYFNMYKKERMKLYHYRRYCSFTSFAISFILKGFKTIRNQNLM